MAEIEGLPISTPELPGSAQNERVGVAHYVIDVDRSSCDVADTVLVTWEIHSCPLHERDFIGMFKVEECAPPGSGLDGDYMSMPGHHVTMDGLLDSRLHGDTSVSGGLIQWTMREDLFQNSMFT